MIAFNNLHIITVSHGEFYVHHFWLLFILLTAIFYMAKG